MRLLGIVCCRPQAYLEPGNKNGEVYLTGLTKAQAVDFTGMARIYMLVDGQVTVGTVKLTSQRGSNLRFNNAILGQLAAKRFKQPWHTRQGTDGTLEILLPLKVS